MLELSGTGGGLERNAATDRDDAGDVGLIAVQDDSFADLGLRQAQGLGGMLAKVMGVR